MGNWQPAYDAAERTLKQKATLGDYNSTNVQLLPNHYTSVESITAYEKIYNATTTLDASQATQSFVDMFNEEDLRSATYFGEKNKDGNYPIKRQMERLTINVAFALANFI